MKFLESFLNSEEFESYQADEIIFNSGSVANEMYVIIDGEVDIIYNDNVLETLTTGDIFGEMALIDNRPRSAVAKSKTDCKILALNKNKFSNLLESPDMRPDFVLHIMKVMSERIRKLNYLLNK